MTAVMFRPLLPSALAVALLILPVPVGRLSPVGTGVCRPDGGETAGPDGRPNGGRPCGPSDGREYSAAARHAPLLFLSPFL